LPCFNPAEIERVTGLALRVRLAPFGDGDLPRPGVVHLHPLLVIGSRAAQIVDMAEICARR